VQLHSINTAEANEEDSEDWIVSFADLVTVLLCFFILYFTDPTEKQIIQDIVEIFKTGDKEVEEIPRTGASLQLSRKDAEMLSSIETGAIDLTKGIEKYGIDFALVRERTELVLRLGDSNMFNIGKFDVTPQGRKVLFSIADKLKPHANKINVIIEAHTDSSPVVGSKNYINNMSLSAIRAASAGNVFIEAGFDENMVFVTGFGASKLLVKDRDDNGEFLPNKAIKNRRIEIRIVPRADK
jgi:chemotaxis protein MotB